jgi:hypothetical protein
MGESSVSHPAFTRERTAPRDSGDQIGGLLPPACCRDHAVARVKRRRGQGAARPLEQPG